MSRDRVDAANVSQLAAAIRRDASRGGTRSLLRVDHARLPTAAIEFAQIPATAMVLIEMMSYAEAQDFGSLAAGAPPVASRAAALVAALSALLPMSDHLWLTTAELCSHLAISRSTLFAIRRSGLLKNGRHLGPPE